MNLSESVKSANTLEEKAKIVWEHYQSRKLASNLEPNWTHVAYDVVRKLSEKSLTDTEDDYHLAMEVISSHALPDGFSVAAFPGMPSSPMRIIHDGWKSGTPTWIFMGRSFPEAAQDIGGGWVAVSRTLPDELFKMMEKNGAPATLWMAYHRDRQMGSSALTSNCVGPAISFRELMAAVEEEKYVTTSAS